MQRVDVVFPCGGTGQAEDLLGGLVRVISAPFRSSYDWNDICTVRRSADGRLCIESLVEKHFAYKTLITHPADRFQDLFEAASRRHWLLVWMRDGRSLLSHPADGEPQDLLHETNTNGHTIPFMPDPWSQWGLSPEEIALICVALDHYAASFNDTDARNLATRFDAFTY